MNYETTQRAIDGLKLQRFWPHVDDIVIDAGRALDVIEELLTNIIELEQRNQALEMTLDRITEKENWEILIDMQRDQLKVRKAFKKVIKQLDDLVKDSA